MVTNRNHAETLVHCLESWLNVREAVANGSMVNPKSSLDQTRGMLVFAIEQTLNELVEAEGDDPR
jgi:hypothetical protein